MVILINYTKLQSQAFHIPIISIFQAHFTSYLSLMIPLYPPLPSLLFFLPHSIFSLLLWPHCCSMAQTYVYGMLRVWKSITSSQHCLNFQLTTLRFISPDTFITSAQPLKHQINATLTKQLFCNHTADTLRAKWSSTDVGWKYSNHVCKDAPWVFCSNRGSRLCVMRSATNRVKSAVPLCSLLFYLSSYQPQQTDVLSYKKDVINWGNTDSPVPNTQADRVDT